MTSNQIVLHVIDVLDRHGIPYMLVGSYSSNVHGIPRSTQDADFVIELPSSTSIGPVAAALAPNLILDPQLHFETVTGNYRYVINHPGSTFKIELFLLSADPHNQERFRRRIRRRLESRDVYFQTAEDVIVQKLKWYIRARREKDREDVLDVLETRLPSLDLIYIRNWCDQHGTRDILEKLISDSASPH